MADTHIAIKSITAIKKTLNDSFYLNPSGFSVLIKLATYLTPFNSTSKIKVARGGMTPPAPFSP